jgi:hypothetical protein
VLRLCGMSTAAVSTLHSLRALKNLSWLTRRRMHKLARALALSRLAKGSIIFDDRNSTDSAYILLSGIAGITCRNRKGERTMVSMLAPGMLPGFPLAVPGSSATFVARRSQPVRSEPLISRRSSKSVWE